MVTIERKLELRDLWEEETNEDWTQEWRDDLDKEEMALVDQWDEAYDSAICRMILNTRQKLDQRKRKG